MEILRIAGFGILATVLLVLTRQQKPEIAVQLSAAVGILIFLFLLDRIAMVFRVLEELASRAELEPYYLQTVLRIIGIAYVAEFGSQICRDADEGVVAAKIELGGKVLIMVLALPVIVAVLDTIIELLP